MQPIVHGLRKVGNGDGEGKVRVGARRIDSHIERSAKCLSASRALAGAETGNGWMTFL